jgi:hypothetical protein
MAGINRKRTAKEYDVKFYVTWNQIRGAFDKKRNGIPTGGFSHNESSAIGLAITYAERLVPQGNTACVCEPRSQHAFSRGRRYQCRRLAPFYAAEGWTDEEPQLARFVTGGRHCLENSMNRSLLAVGTVLLVALAQVAAQADSPREKTGHSKRPSMTQDGRMMI